MVNVLSTFLVSLNTARKVDTVEHGTVRGLLVANPAEVKSKALAREYLDIAVGDEIIACSEGGVRWRANVDEILDATVSGDDDDANEGDPVRVLKGTLVARGSRSLAAICKQMRDEEKELPGIVNTRGSGFRQGALATRLTDEQNESFSAGLA